MFTDYRLHDDDAFCEPYAGERSEVRIAALYELAEGRSV
jgi:hypothetical protein